MSELISYDLPFGVKIGVNDRTKDHEPGTPNKVASISSNLDTEISYESADTLEWFLLAKIAVQPYQEHKTANAPTRRRHSGVGG